jgi:hypothetical protein
MSQTIEDLLRSMVTLSSDKQKEGGSVIGNSKEMWARIGSGDSFSDLGFNSEEEKKEWMSDNPYSSI